MSGHSKWATIRRKKEKIDSARGKVFTKVIRELTIAARLGGSSPDTNPRLRSAIDAAKAANMPADNVDRAIKKAAGELEGQVLEEIVYEGYGPGGVAILVNCVTDNKNRTVGEVRHTFTKRNGTMAEAGAVSWMFDRLGFMTLDESQGSEDEIMEIALDAGATDVKSEDGQWEIYTAPEDLYKVKGVLESKGKKVDTAEISYIPKNTVKLAAEQAKAVLRLVEAFEELDDIQQVYSNFDIDEEVMASLE
jgi:YebC/PmpR family DNA-binding regulatory protein